MGTQLDKHGPRNLNLNVLEMDSKKIDLNLIHQNLETSVNPTLSLYNYLLEKGIVKVA